jgi:hypothetical protein
MVTENNIRYAHIYRMEDINTGYFYIGSSFNELKQRKAGHREKCKKNPNVKVYKYLNDWGNIKMTCLLKFECNNKQDRDIKEGKYIRLYFDDELNVNSNKTGTGLTKEEYAKQYANENKEDISIKKKEWRKQNKHKIKEWLEINKDKIKKTTRKYNTSNKDTIKKTTRKYREINIDYIKDYDKKRYIENKNNDEYIQKRKEYYERSKEVIKQRQNKKIICKCGVQYTNVNKSRHEKTKKHKELISINLQT